MRLYSWLWERNGTNGLAQSARARQSKSRPTPRTHFQVEALEDRCLLSGGVLDPTFGSGGVVTTTVGTYSRAFAVATYANGGTSNDGKIVAAGDAFPSGSAYFALARYHPLDGALDRTFGGTGAVLATPGRALAVQV